jgi:O-antigen biosynthesis protein
MALKHFCRWLTLPLKVASLVTQNRLKRLWYYLRTNQTGIVFDRVKRLLELGTATPMSIQMYSHAHSPGPLVFPSCQKPLVSIVIPVHNQWEITRNCLISIQENTDTIPYEVIIADDASYDDTLHLAKLAPGVHHCINSENLGFLRNCNRASMQAKGKYLLLLNNDTQVQWNWLAPLVELAEQDEGVGIAGPMLLYPDGRLQEAGGIIWKDGSGWNYGRLDYPERSEYNYLKETDYISGACILVRKSMWDEIGGFDERFTPAYFEDTDLAFEARRRGYKVLYQPLSRVVHLEGISHGTDLEHGIKSRQKVNQSAFREKWARTLDATHGRDPRDLFRARDRSLNRKRLLFIDHYVPLRDQDAGSKSTFQYLALMSEMGYQITFLGDNFVDYQPYTSELQQLGIEVLYGPGLRRHWKRWLSAHGKEFDYVYLSRPHITRKYLPHIRKHSPAKVLYCGHDLHFLREERHYQIEGRNTYLQSAKKWARWEEDILRQVDMGYFFSTFEIAEVRRRFPGTNVRTIPLYLFEDTGIEQSANTTVGFDDRKGLLFVGGFMHRPNVDAVHWFVEKIMPIILKNQPEIVLTVVGSNPPREISRLASDHVHITGRVSDEALLQHYRHTRLVVAPLRFGAGVKGKIVEAMHQGVPTVTTSVGAEGIGDADCALIIADDAVTFSDKVLQAYSCSTTWEQAARLSPKAIQRNFSKEAARAILSQDMPL